MEKLFNVVMRTAVLSVVGWLSYSMIEARGMTVFISTMFLAGVLVELFRNDK